MHHTTFACTPAHNRVEVFNNGRGLNWYVVALVDREYLLGEVDALNTATQEDIRKSESKVDDDLEKARMILYIVVVVAALIPIGLTVYLVFRITKPLIQLMEDMSHVAVMDLDHVDAARPLSSLAEVHGMEKSFKQMMKNLVEYRQYLPQSVLVDTMSEDDTTLHVSTRETVSIKSGAALSQKSGFTGSSLSHAVLVFGNGLKTKSVAMLVANVADMHQITSHTKVSETLSLYIETFVNAAKGLRGIVDEVSGDRITISFNTIISSANYRSKSMELAYHARDTLGTRVVMNCAASSGKAMCGNTGCTGLKKYAIIGPVAVQARVFERCGRKWGFSIVCDGDIASEAKQRCLLKKIIKVSVKGGKATILHELVSLRAEESGEEWMYQLEQAAAKDPFNYYNTAMSSIYQGKLEEAEEDLRRCSVPDQGLITSLLNILRSTREAPEPMVLNDVPELK